MMLCDSPPRNDEDRMAQSESFSFLHYSVILGLSVNKLLILRPQFVNREFFVANRPFYRYNNKK